MNIISDDLDRIAIREYGDELFENEQFLEAIQVFQLVLDNFPSDVLARSGMAKCFFNLELDGLAIKEIEYLKAHNDDLSSMDLEQYEESYKFNIVEILLSTGCFDAAIPILEKRINDEPTDHVPHWRLGFVYDKMGNYAASYDKYTDVYNLFETPEDRSIVLPMRIEACKKLNDKKQVAALIAEAWELRKLGYNTTNLLYHLSADEYNEGNYQQSLDLLNQARESEESDEENAESESNLVNDRYFGGILALNIALDQREEARIFCVNWLDEYGDKEATDMRGVNLSIQVDACLQSLKEVDLLNRYAQSVFLRSSAPSLEFALKALAARMQGNDRKAFQEFVKYKQVLKEQLEERGDNFEEEWEAMKSDEPDIKDFVIPDSDPRLAILVDDYIERYGK